jgi:transcriptional regulator with XRE-family HTH domain
MSLHPIPSPQIRRPPSEFNLRAGRLLRQRRVNAGLSQEEVGERVGVSHQCYQRHENGTIVINLPRLVKLGRAIGFDPVEFLRDVLGDSLPIKRVEREAKDLWAAKASEVVTRISSTRDKKLVLAFAKRLAEGP